MNPLARRPFGTLPMSGSRIEARLRLVFSAMLHVDAADGHRVNVTDLTPGGCRVTAAIDAPVATHVSLTMPGATLISGRIAWNDGDDMGVNFCMPLLPRIVAA